jgi:hypothetical protein
MLKMKQQYLFAIDFAVRFGPDTQWVEDIDYSVSAASAAQFEEAIRRYVKRSVIAARRQRTMTIGYWSGVRCPSPRPEFPKPHGKRAKCFSKNEMRKATVT